MSCFLLKALVALKKGTQLLKYSRKGKPKFRPFRLSAVSLCFLFRQIIQYLVAMHMLFLTLWGMGVRTMIILNAHHV